MAAHKMAAASSVFRRGGVVAVRIILTVPRNPPNSAHSKSLLYSHLGCSLVCSEDTYVKWMCRLHGPHLPDRFTSMQSLWQPNFRRPFWVRWQPGSSTEVLAYGTAHPSLFWQPN